MSLILKGAESLWPRAEQFQSPLISINVCCTQPRIVLSIFRAWSFIHWKQQELFHYLWVLDFFSEVKREKSFFKLAIKILLSGKTLKNGVSFPKKVWCYNKSLRLGKEKIKKEGKEFKKSGKWHVIPWHTHVYWSYSISFNKLLLGSFLRLQN